MEDHFERLNQVLKFIYSQKEKLIPVNDLLGHFTIKWNLSHSHEVNILMEKLENDKLVSLTLPPDDAIRAKACYCLTLDGIIFIEAKGYPELDRYKNLTCFEDIFTTNDWRKYVDVLTKVEPPLLDPNWKFIGKKGDKGVICSWFTDLQKENKIKAVDKSTLSRIINAQIKNIEIGTHGRTFGNYSNRYEVKYKSAINQLISD
jgi:hypothetical protein